MTPDWPVVATEILMLPLTVSAALLGTWLHHRDNTR